MNEFYDEHGILYTVIIFAALIRVAFSLAILRWHIQQTQYEYKYLCRYVFI